MQVSTDVALSDDEQAEVAAILRCSTSDLEQKLAECSRAAMKEYLGMFRGQKVFKRGTDIYEYRLLLLIETIFGGSIPDEQDVCNLFQTTLNESRSLIRAVLSKFQYQLQTPIEGTLRSVLDLAKQKSKGTDYTVVINSRNIVDELNQRLASIDGTLSQISKQKGSVSTYEIKPASYKALDARISKVKSNK